MISHDLSVVSYISDRIGVMQSGKLVETGTVDEIFERPTQPYTRMLLAAVPHTDPRRRDAYLSAGTDAESCAPAGSAGFSDAIEAPYAERLRNYADRVRAAQSARQSVEGNRE